MTFRARYVRGSAVRRTLGAMLELRALRFRILATFAGSVVAAAVLLAACGDPADRSSAAGPETWTVAAEPVLRIGEQDGEAAYLFDRVSAVRLLDDGGVVVADRRHAEIRVYDEEGVHLTSMGGPGEGPGEFEVISYLTIHPPDTLLAYDGFAYRTTRFLLDGTLAGNRPIRPENGAPEMYLGTYADGDAAIASLIPPPRGGTEVIPDRMSIGRYDQDGSRVAELTVADGIRRAGGAVVIPFSPYLHARMLRDSIYYTDGLKPALFVLDDEGNVARTIELPIPRPDHEAAWNTLHRELEARDETSWLDDVTPEIEAEPVPTIAEVVFDADERIWVKHYEPRTDAMHLRRGLPSGGRWTVVRPDGEILAHVDLPEGFAPLDASGRRVAGVHRDELDVERVVVFELRG
ncbi:MAG: hypothetical protein U5R14_00155 [Gemmatimonadota bacterium]|nr:hypothetical protein [Gemmatimonadota bacterium]